MNTNEPQPNSPPNQGGTHIGVINNSGVIITGGTGTTVNIDQRKSEAASVAAEIQRLLEQLEQSYSADTTGRGALATEAVKQIDGTPALKSRFVSALKAGGVNAFEELLSHPAASFVIAAAKDWQNTSPQVLNTHNSKNQ
jgi:hypothetical protein